MRLPVTVVAATIGLTFGYSVLPVLAKHHRHHSSSSEAVSQAPTQHHHKTRAEREAYQQHLQRLWDMDPVERRALRRHNELIAEQQQDQAPVRHHRHHHDVAQASDDQPLHHRRHHHSQDVASTAHDRRLAAREAREQAARVRAHNERLAERAVQDQMHKAKLLADHNARLAAEHAHYVALHGDDSAGKSIRYWETVAVDTPVKVITVDLNDTQVKVSAVMADHGDGTSEPFKQMIQRASPNVAVTGTFFSLDNLKPVGDIVIGGGLVHFGGMGTALCVTDDNKASMVTCQWGRHHDWSAYDFVCACGPRLLESGRIVLDPHAERFKDRHMLAPNSRIAVGITKGNKLVFAMTREPIYLGRLAKVMKSLGCSEAMNLDAGTSSGFYYNGTTLCRPGRWLTNMIVVYGSRNRYERALDQLVPPPYRSPEWLAQHRQASN